MKTIDYRQFKLPEGRLSAVAGNGTIIIGADPELFFVNKRGRVVGSDRVITSPIAAKDAGVSKDGVQVELNPQPTTCRANVGNSLSHAFLYLAHVCKKEDVRLSFKQVVPVTLTELKQLSTGAQQLGCQPSKSAYGLPDVKVDGMQYRKRSAGGHIHLGTTINTKNGDWIAKVLDATAGVVCVLLDRSPDAAERRKYYGRAGEYRIQPHGFEYRTLSNFWLRSYPLFSLVAALCRTGLQFAKSPRSSELMEHVDEAELQRIINENDFDAAMEFFTDILVPHYFHKNMFYEGITAETVNDFMFFVTAKSIEEWFPTNPLEHWVGMQEGHGTGWESFVANRVRPERKRYHQELGTDSQDNLLDTKTVLNDYRGGRVAVAQRL